MFLTLLLLIALFPQDPECTTWSACRDAALAAAEQKEYERFHDLAWRATQKGPRNSPELMLLLARAQSLSGRPLDALVMLGRLADMGVESDAATSDDFRRVRALARWPEVERRIAEAGESAASTPAVAKTEPSPPATPERAAPKTPAPDPPDEAEPPISERTELRFNTLPFTPAGLAYDAVSRRFIVGDRQARKLAVVDEFSHQIANLASAQATGFADVAALEIDPREGNLWVVTADENGTPKAGTTLHKLQLISGRALASLSPPPAAGSARFTDVAITPRGLVVVVDQAGRRLYQLRPGARALELVATLGDVVPFSVAPGPSDVAYVTHEAGIARVELRSGAVSTVTAAQKVTLTGLERLRWHAGSLVGLQKLSDGTHRAVRLTLNREGRRVSALQVLDSDIRSASPAATSISGNELFYLTQGEAGEMIVRRIALTR
jgi:hypothetical protein